MKQTANTLNLPDNPQLRGEALTLGYFGKPVVNNLSVSIPSREFTVIIGPNGCGKSTLLKALSRVIKPQQGHVLFNGKALQDYPSKILAQQLGLLPQSSQAPDGITVRELVSRGRYPHQSWLKQWSRQDETTVERAMRYTGVAHLAEQSVDALSGGQRQRVWIAMVLAQDTPLILLDEPTTYLDITHQIELLELFIALNQQTGKTLVAVLHDINQACRYATHLIVMRDGQIFAQGKPSEIVTSALMLSVFDLDCHIIQDPISHTPLIIPHRQPHLF